MATTPSAERCCKMVHPPGPWRQTFGERNQCRRAAVVARDGKGYCKQHDPVAVAEKRKAQSVKWEAESKAREAGYRRRAAEESACVGIPTEALEAGAIAELVEACERLVERLATVQAEFEYLRDEAGIEAGAVDDSAKEADENAIALARIALSKLRGGK